MAGNLPMDRCNIWGCVDWRLALFFTIFAQAWGASEDLSLAHCTEVRELVLLLYSNFVYKALWLT